MKKLILFSGFLVILFTICYFQFFTKPDVLSSSNFSSENEYSERVDITLNRAFILNKKAIADELLDMRLNNSFHSIMFSKEYPDTVTFTVYTNKITHSFYKEAFVFSCFRDGDNYIIEIGE